MVLIEEENKTFFRTLKLRHCANWGKSSFCEVSMLVYLLDPCNPMYIIFNMLKSENMAKIIKLNKVIRALKVPKVLNVAQ